MPPISRKQHILDSLSINIDNSSSCSTSLHSSDSFSSSLSPSFCQPSSAAGSDLVHDPSQYARVNRVILDKNSDEYRKRRERNNIAVKKSRTKSKIKTIQTLQQVNLLKAENEFLSRKVDMLSRELRVLKDIFVSHASNAHGTRITDYDLTLLTGGSNVTNALERHASFPLSPLSSTYNPESTSPGPIQVRDQLYLPSSFRRHANSLSLSSGSSIQDSEDDL